MSHLGKDLPAGLIPQPEGYADCLTELKTRIHSAQQRAALAVNRELVLLYWQIGRDILARQSRKGWGAKVIDRLAQDLRTAFPNMKGFSPRNLKCMRAFAKAWPNAEFVQEVPARLPWCRTAVDAQVKHAQDGPTIGLQLCKSRSKVVASHVQPSTNWSSPCRQS